MSDTQHGIEFFNIRSGERRIAVTEPQIAALWGSSDRHDNRGQDFGWRLSEPVVLELERIQRSERKLESIALKYGIPVETITEYVIIKYILDKNTPRYEDGESEDGEDYESQYEENLRKLRESNASKTKKAPVEEVIEDEDLDEDEDDEEEQEQEETQTKEIPQVSADLQRKDLDEIAKGLGIESAKYSTKEALAKAINQKTAENSQS